MKFHYIYIGLFLGCFACNNIEDVAPSDRQTFIRVYEGVENLSGITAEEIEGGYVILARKVETSGTSGLFIRTDRSGNEIPSETISLPDFAPRAMKVTDQGYFLVGDRIKFNPLAENLFDLTVTSAKLYRVSLSGDTTSLLRSDTAKVAKTDFHGSSVTMNSGNQIIMLGTFKPAKAIGAFDRPFVAAINPATMDTVWTRRYDILERDYVNGKSVHATSSGNLIWASALLRNAGDISRTYLSIPYVKEKSTFVNNDIFAENTDQALFANDLQPAESPDFGYGLIGTYALPTGKESNIVFLRVDKNGNFIDGSERFFDGELSAGNQPVTAGQSSSEDTGDAITSTRDGGFILAGTFQTTPNRGNGGRDLILIKVDALGTVVWNKILGGEGDETVSSIRETGDGGLLICGGNNVSGLSSIFIMKTDANGELKN